MIIDTHCHLDDERYSDDIDEVIKRAKEQGVERFIIPGAEASTLSRAVELSELYDEVYFAVGIHPYHAEEYDKAYLEKFVEHPKCVAIGECGLDYYRLPKEEKEIIAQKRLQKEVFIQHIELAKRFKLPLIVHIRDSSADFLEILEKYAGVEGGVLHCYNADESLLKLASRGFYFGIGGVITFQNAKKLVNVYSKIPLDKLMIETDAPYLTPHPHRGKRNEPSYTKFVASKMAQLSQIEQGVIEEATTDNAKRLFYKMGVK